MLLSLPRPIEPTEIPMPAIDGAALARVAQEDARLADEARRGLDVDVRALGSEIRAFGRADALGELHEVGEARPKVVAAAHAAVAHGARPLLALRAFQLQAFVREVRRYEATGEPSDDLVELGGSFVRMLELERSGWIERTAAGKARLVVPPDVLGVLFKRRWNEITTLMGEELALRKEEQRALLVFLLRHPPRQPLPGTEPSAEPTPFERAQQDDLRLKKIDELAQLDPAYPASLARAVIHHRRGRWAKAADELRRHLDASPDGPWTLRAQNHLRAALERAATEGAPP
jgi:hypothetical protein